METIEKNKNVIVWIWIALGLVILIAGILFFVYRDKSIVDKDVVPVTDVINSTEPNQVTEKTIGVGAVPISYTNALIKYADRRIQLSSIDGLCTANPNIVTYKDNTGIMIDNRSPLSLTVKINTTFTIKPYGFKIVVLPDVALKSKTILVDCNQSQNIATILVQE